MKMNYEVHIFLLNYVSNLVRLKFEELDKLFASSLPKP